MFYENNFRTTKMTAREFIDIIKPQHDRSSCDDDNLNNGFYSYNGKTWHCMCKRCMYLEIENQVEIPADFVLDSF